MKTRILAIFALVVLAISVRVQASTDLIALPMTAGDEFVTRTMTVIDRSDKRMNTLVVMRAIDSASKTVVFDAYDGRPKTVPMSSIARITFKQDDVSAHSVVQQCLPRTVVEKLGESQIDVSLGSLKIVEDGSTLVVRDVRAKARLRSLGNKLEIKTMTFDVDKALCQIRILGVRYSHDSKACTGGRNGPGKGAL